MSEGNSNIELPLEMYDMIISYLAPKDLYDVYIHTYPSYISDNILENIKNGRILRDPRDKVQVLYYGLMDRNQEITHLLIDKIPNNMLDMNDLLIQAIKNGDDYIVDYAINTGANKIDEALKEAVHVDNRQLIRKLATTYPRLDTVFNEAILVNNQELVEDIVSYGRLDIHVLNRGLENAVMRGNIDMINYILQLGPDDYSSGLAGAAKGNNLELFKWFLDLYNNHPKRITRYSIAHIFAQIKDPNILEHMMIYYSDTLKSNSDRKFILKKAAEIGNLFMVKYLLSKYKFNKQNLEDAAFEASYNERKDIVDYFKELGVYVVEQPPIEDIYNDEYFYDYLEDHYEDTNYNYLDDENYYDDDDDDYDEGEQD